MRGWACCWGRLKGTESLWGEGGGGRWNGRQGRVGPPQLPRESPEPQFIQLPRQCKQTVIEGDEKGAGAGRAAQTEAAAHENRSCCQGLCFGCCFQARKRTALRSGPIRHLVVQNNRFSISITVIKPVTQFLCRGCWTVRPAFIRVRSNRGFTAFISHVLIFLTVQSGCLLGKKKKKGKWYVSALKGRYLKIVLR